jgi:3-oxoacyl-[acyl-carrier-protein] synthase-3
MQKGWLFLSFIQYENVKIAAVACATPSFSQKLEINPQSANAAYLQNYVKTTGVEQRYVSVNGQTGADLCYAAALKAFDLAKWSPDSVDAIIALTQTPDYRRPGNGCLLQYRLGMRKDSIAYDINLGCSAFPYALFAGGSMMQGTDIRRVALAFSETVNADFEKTEDMLAEIPFLFGEAGAVVLLEKMDAPAIRIALWSDGSGYKYLFLPFCGARNPFPREQVFVLPSGEKMFYSRHCSQGYMDGVEVFSFATSTAVEAIQTFEAHFKTTSEMYDGLILHQANLQIIKTMAKRLGFPMERVPISINRYGNTSTSSIPLVICDAYTSIDKKKIRLLTSGYGIGLSWGVADIEIESVAILPVFATDERFDEGCAKCAEGVL